MFISRSLGFWHTLTNSGQPSGMFISRGFVYVRENEDIIEQTRDVVRAIVASYGQIEGSDWPSIKNRIKDELHRFIYEKIKRNPMILPIIVDLG